MSCKTWRDSIKFPVMYDGEGYIVDKKGNPILEIRGYGDLISSMSPERAGIEQFKFGAWVASTLNERRETEKRVLETEKKDKIHDE
jgi:hypothetical protein